MTLATQLGSFIGQLAETSLKSISIEFQGHVAELNVKPLVSAVLDGMLRYQLDSVNMVSAPMIARDRGIDISETIHEHPGAAPAIVARTTIATIRIH